MRLRMIGIKIGIAAALLVAALGDRAGASAVFDVSQVGPNVVSPPAARTT
jgi:hypothetical protein